MCGLSYRIAEASYEGEQLSTADTLTITDDFETYLSRTDAIPSSDDDRMMLAHTLTMALSVMETLTPKDTMLEFSKRVATALVTSSDVEFRKDANQQLQRFRAS